MAEKKPVRRMPVRERQKNDAADVRSRRRCRKREPKAERMQSQSIRT